MRLARALMALPARILRAMAEEADMLNASMARAMREAEGMEYDAG